MNLDPLADSLAAAGLGTLGNNLFVHFMPDDCRAGVVLVGKLSGTPIDPELKNYRSNAGFQVVVRHSSYEDGFTLMRQVMDRLTVEKTMMTGMFVNYIRPRHEPVVFPRSAGNSLEFSVNFDANYVVL